MATKRFGYLDDFSLKNQKVGIGTSTANEKLEVLGGTRGEDVVVTGIATLTSYSGFDNTKTSYVENLVIAGGESGTLSGEIVIGAGLTMSVGTGATTGQGSIKSLKVSNIFNPPVGLTTDRPSAPKPGALFYNKDFRTIEYWDGNFWRQVDNTTRSGRGLFGGGSTPSRITDIEYINIPSQGNGTSFGELTVGRSDCGSCSSEIRGIWTGGFDDSTPTYNDQIDYVTLASEGNAIDFGNLSSPRQPPTSFSSSTRGITAGGYVSSPGAYSNIIDYVEIATIGNATDFGDLTVGRGGPASVSSPTRGVIAGGISPTLETNTDFVTIASTGNATDFGKLTAGVRFGGASNPTRGIFTCAGPGPNYHGVGYQYITIASTGNAQYFADMISQLRGAGTADQTRAVFGGGTTPARLNNLEYVTIASTGTAFDFGDMSVARADWDGACSDSHGGLGGF